MAYGEFVKNISKKVNQRISDISAEYNFDFGDEFEIAIGKALQTFLPERYGVCRGFAVDVKGEKAGDDLLIYDRDRFSILRLLDDVNLERKQEIPIEAVYAYIECKHTIFLEGEGPQSLNKALLQVENVKKLKRASVPLTQISPYSRFSPGSLVKPITPYWPDFRNPLYTAIIARNVFIDAGKKETDAHEITSNLSKGIIKERKEFQPDLIIFGNDIAVLPAVDAEENDLEASMESPFFVTDKSTLLATIVPGLAFGIGFCFMSWAFDYISLGKMQWGSLLNDALVKAEN